MKTEGLFLQYAHNQFCVFNMYEIWFIASSEMFWVFFLLFLLWTLVGGLCSQAWSLYI